MSRQEYSTLAAILAMLEGWTKKSPEFQQWLYGKDGALEQAEAAFVKKMESKGQGEQAKALIKEGNVSKGLLMGIIVVFAADVIRGEVDIEAKPNEEALKRTIWNPEWEKAMLDEVVDTVITCKSNADSAQEEQPGSTTVEINIIVC